MSTKADKAPNVAQHQECLHLRKFKDFLLHAVGVVGSDNATTSEQRNCMRNNNETYPVTSTELKGELIMAIWNQLQTKQCPYHFQLPILHAVLSELSVECQNTKDNEFMHTATCKSGDESGNEVQYDLTKLQKFVVNNLEKFLTRLTDNAELGNLHTYAENGVLCESTHDCQCSDSTSTTTPTRYVVSCIKNKPRKMEDRYICLERYGEMYELKSKYSFYGVFDGHSGPLAANYALSQLPYLLAKHLKSAQLNSPDDYRLAFESAFLKTDEQFALKRISSGTTAVCALISDMTATPHLYVAWVGDSRALLVGGEASLQLVKSHKPDSLEERNRIEESGGTVMHVQGQWRVNGFLNVARSIGDYSVDVVIAEPDFVDVPLTANYDFLVLGTDGLWDHVTEAGIISTIYDALEDEEQNIVDIPKKLIEMAKEGDSQDNITVVIVFLKQRFEIVKQRSKPNV